MNQRGDALSSAKSQSDNSESGPQRIKIVLPLSATTKPGTRGGNNQKDNKKTKSCKFFAVGKCRFGADCHFKHEKPAPARRRRGRRGGRSLSDRVVDSLLKGVSSGTLQVELRGGVTISSKAKKEHRVRCYVIDLMRRV